MWLEGLIILVVIVLALTVGCTCMHVSCGPAALGAGRPCWAVRVPLAQGLLLACEHLLCMLLVLALIPCRCRSSARRLLTRPRALLSQRRRALTATEQRRADGCQLWLRLAW